MTHIKQMYALVFFLLSPYSCTQKAEASYEEPVVQRVQASPDKAIQLSKEALAYCKANGFNTEWCLMADMSQHSGLERFFVWSFREDTIIDRGLVSHGCGSNAWGSDESKTSPIFSNDEGSHLSSLGKYRVGERGPSQWGIGVKYLLYGLESSNRNAAKRIIVLHGWSAVPEESPYPAGAPEGWGCPAVSNTFMQRLDSMLTASPKPVLLWMFE